jgi:hypothetical protein
VLLSVSTNLIEQADILTVRQEYFRYFIHFQYADVQDIGFFKVPVCLIVI